MAHGYSYSVNIAHAHRYAYLYTYTGWCTHGHKYGNKGKLWKQIEQLIAAEIYPLFLKFFYKATTNQNMYF